MKTIYKSQLPKPEAEVRADLTTWLAAKEAHKQTVGVPAPFPEYELLNYLSSDFVVFEDDEVKPEEPKTLEELKQLKNAQIDKWRGEANRTSFSFSDKQIAVDVLSRSDIDGIAAYVSLHNALPPSFPGSWKAMDNSYVPIPDVDTFKSMIAAMVVQGSANFTKSQQLKAQLEAATSDVEVEAIQW